MRVAKFRLTAILGIFLALLVTSAASANSVSENWNCADNPNSISCQQTWTYIEGGGAPANLQLISNTARIVASSSVSVRADVDLATTDHWAQAELIFHSISTSFRGGIICRKDSSATATYYYADLAAPDNV